MMLPEKIYLLVDYRGFFYSSVRNIDVGMDIELLEKAFSKYGMKLIVVPYKDLVIDDQWKNRLVLFQSTEDELLLYKDYIEDVILGLKLAGAIIIPQFEHFRCHHNKSFQEIYRKIKLPAELSSIASESFGCYEDLLKTKKVINTPVVLKKSEGAKSRGVILCKDKNELFKNARKITRSFNLISFSKDYVKSKLRPYHVKVSQNRKKFILQKFIADLKGDYKVVIYGNRCFALRRFVREGDFRASGSGKFEVNKDIPLKVIKYAFELNKAFAAPWASYDIAYRDDCLEVMEFQFMTFGTTVVFLSERYYELQTDGNIVEVSQQLVLENVFVDAVVNYMEKFGPI